MGKPKRADKVTRELVARSRKFGVLTAGAAFLSACAVTEPPLITSSTGPALAGQAVRMAPFESDGSHRAFIGSALEQAFASHGVSLGENAQLIAEFAVAERLAEAGVADPEASSGENIVWSSSPRDDRLFDACEARRLRATLVLLDRADGSLAYRGVAEATECAFTQAHFASMAEALVQDAVVRTQ